MPPEFRRSRWRDLPPWKPPRRRNHHRPFGRHRPQQAGNAGGRPSITLYLTVRSVAAARNRAPTIPTLPAAARPLLRGAFLAGAGNAPAAAGPARGLAAAAAGPARPLSGAAMAWSGAFCACR